MESSDTQTSKKVSLEDLSKEDLIKKCNNFLSIAKKAKQAKDESMEELKKYKENEMKLSSDVAALKEIVESFNKKQNEFAEVQNKHKLSEEKNSELTKGYQKLEERYAKKIAECSVLEETLKKLSDKICTLENSNSEYVEKLNDFKENYAKIDIENKMNGERLRESKAVETDLRNKLQIAEEKYIKLELTLKEFQGKYIEECKNYEGLQETLAKLQNRNSSGRCSSRSSDSLKPVYENQEYDEMLEKYNDLNEKYKVTLLEMEKLNKKLCENENLEKEWSSKHEALEEKYNELLRHCDEIVAENKNLHKIISENESLLKEKDTKCAQLVDELNRKSILLSDHEELVKEFEIIKNKLENSVGVPEKGDRENNVDKERLHSSDKECDTIAMDATKKQGADLANHITELEELNVKYLTEIEKLTNIIKDKEMDMNKERDKLKEKMKENEMMRDMLDENDKLLIELKKNYESVIFEKDKLIEMCHSEKWTEETFKQNISQLTEELVSLRKENDVADKKYKEMERKLEESRRVSELLKREIDGKCDEYDKFKREMEFHKKKNDELNAEIRDKDRAFSSCKVECEELRKSEKDHINMIEELKRSLKSATDLLKIRDEELSTTRERNTRNLYSFADIPGDIKDEHRDLLTRYAIGDNMIDSLRIVQDLAVAQLKTDPDRKVDQLTQTEGTQGRTNITDEAMVARMQNKIKDMMAVVNEMKTFKSQIWTEVRDCVSTLQEGNNKIKQDVAKSISDVFCGLRNGQAELLSEMNDMNQVLKERGEAISKLEQVNETQRKELLEVKSQITDLENKLEEKKTRIKNVTSELEDVKSEVDNKAKTIKEMEEEIWKLKSTDSAAEALSSSTLSRVEEAARLMDIEDSFEERYSKLKVVAAKLKKKVSEQQKQLEEERSKYVDKSNEFQNKIANFQSQIKSLMNLQSDYDRLQDKYEEEKKERNAMKKSLESSDEKIESLKQEVENLKRDKDKLLNDKTTYENTKKKLSAQIITLKALIEEEKNKQAKAEREIEKVEQERTLKEKKLEEEKEKHKATMALFEKQKMEAKNLGVLKLEIDGYEKSIRDLEKKLTMREEDVKEMTCLMENQKSQCKLYLDEITHLKSQLTQENERATEVSNQMRKCSEESSNREAEFKAKLGEIEMLKNAVEERKKEFEEVTLELAKVSQEKMKMEEKYKSIQDHCSREIHSLKDTVGNLQDSLNQKELELSELKKEFDAYKVRAQSVLRQSQKEMNQSKQRNVMEELEQMRSTSESLKFRLEESGQKMQKLIEENEVFQEEKNRLYGRIQELKNSLAESRTEVQELKQTRQKEVEEHNEALKLQKLQSETLAHCFQKNIEEMERNHSAKMEVLVRENEHMKTQIEKFANEKVHDRREYTERRRSTINFIPVKSDKDVLDVMLLEREECEGSESVDSISPQAGTNANLIPLDQLLNSPDQDRETEEKRSPFQDVNQMKDKLEKSENRIKHLTVLLSEAESDCARLQHLNDVLKEEIRRNQRNIEREKHAQNFEYMKNVVLKFISLHHGDEKTRLVPVLNTILKLSPEEETILANAAKGIVDSSHSSRGWGSYLNIWPSTQ